MVCFDRDNPVWNPEEAVSVASKPLTGEEGGCILTFKFQAPCPFTGEASGRLSLS